jgi:hypothetical protein
LPINNFIKSDDGEIKENAIPTKPLPIKVGRGFLFLPELDLMRKVKHLRLKNI